ncbi:hypothetical protein A2763_04085 [Candidatus Kaiserbacteria bacterium RIFCSPHIGHO2_01_FULL_54_36]|uniref:Peptidase M15A C-terminal domain-containing protein n=1 Tax=Candidatus Kaiserbacteria bacterium RIFCSPHIGHO2_01_FULL_54_36 TaxID=1798482 RepID=A0A1F6CK02_9BACT|nr:MAG: hypothetical protein A2763_04085 [Candidatus Kaiserbacteria bacterium RIFCSPHIGHO2_01_FULL_54_36]OGG75658.1 MAG: hypothetical protein A3A41_00895 [Candidatus Kaiserbacteria bacterium RIFCSPLOWO2_01_FULL_54_22]
MLRIPISLLAGIAFLFVLLTLSVAYAQGTNCRTATAAEIAAGALPGRPVCDSDRTAGLTNDAGQAKAYLASIARDLRNSKAPPTSGGRIDKLNNAFATCAAKFLQAFARAHGPIYVVSAFRCGPNSPAHIQCDRTENARAGGATRSNHQLGLAMDVNPASNNYVQLHAFARSNPQFGVGFPLGMGDRPHMEPTNKRSPSCSGVAGTPVAAPSNAPASSRPVGQATPIASAAPSADAGSNQPQIQMNTAECFTSLNPPTIAQPGTVLQSQCLTNASGQPTQPPPQSAAPSQPSLPAQPSQGAQPVSSAQPSISAQPTLPLPTISSETTPISSLLNTNTLVPGSQSATNTQPKATSSFNLIEQYINPVSNLIDIGKVVPINLNPNVIDVAIGLSPSSTSSQSVLTASGTVVAQGPLQQQTFTSGDLANNYVAPPRAQNTFLLRLLDTMQGVLIYASNYLKPFGGVPGHAGLLE